MTATPLSVNAPPLKARLFGSFSLTDEDGVNLTPNARKARALFACLLLAGEDGMTRDRLASLLWSRSGEEQARASLRQAFYDLRALAAGDTPAISVDRLTAKVVSGRVRSDLDEIRNARLTVDASSLAAIVGDEPRELLADLNGIDDGLDEWLRNERVRRGDERRAACLGVAEVAFHRDDWRGAQRLAGSLLAADPTDEAAARLAMQAARASGDRDGVRQVFARLEQALRNEIDAGASMETIEVHRVLMLDSGDTRSSVDKLSAERITPDVDAADPDYAKAPSMTAETQAPRRSDARWIVAACALVSAVVAVWMWQRSTVPSGPRQLLVRPLVVPEGDSAAQALASGFPNDLARAIVGNDATLAVVDPDSASRVVQRRTDLVITGDATNDAGMLRINVKLRRASESTLLWSSSFARPAADAAMLREQIAIKVAGVAVCGFGGKHPTPEDFDAQTLQLYLGACEQKYGDWAEAAKLLGQVVARRPDYAHGWAMLAAGTSTAAYFRPAQTAELHQQALDYAKRALALDQSDGEAYFAQADAQPGIGQWAQRMSILDAGHAADPTNASVNGSRGSELAKVGRLHEAIAAAQVAADAEPFSPVHISNLARLRAFGSSAEAAEAALAVGRARFPLVGYFARTDFRVAALLGDPRRAAEMLGDPRLRLTGSPAITAAWKALIEARIDPSPAKIEIAVRQIREDSQSAGELLPSLQKLMALGRVDDAYALAADTKERPDSGQEILFQNLLTAFRADPRFMTVAARLGLVAIWLQTERWPDFCTDKSLGYDCRAEAQRAMSPQARSL